MKELLQEKLEEKFMITPNLLIGKEATVSAEAITAYLLMKEHATVLNFCETTLNIMAKKITNSNVTKMVNSLKPALQELVDLGCIAIFSSEYNVQEGCFDDLNIDDLKANDTFVVVFQDYEGKYFKVPYMKYREVLELAKDIKNRFAFIAYFTSIMRFTNSDKHPVVAYVHSVIWSKFIKHHKTVKEYREILAENGIIWVSARSFYTPESGRSVSARLGRIEHFESQEQFEKYVTSHAIMKKWSESNTEQINKKRSIGVKKSWDKRRAQEKVVEPAQEGVEEVIEMAEKATREKVLVKGFTSNDVYVDLEALLEEQKLTPEQYFRYKSEAIEKGFILEFEETLLEIAGFKMKR